MHTKQCTPTISIILPVRNEEQFLPSVLDNLIHQNYPKDKMEILIVDGMSTDMTLTIAKKYAKRHAHITVLRNVLQLSSSSRNIGIRCANGEYIVIIDGHCVINRSDYINSVAKAFMVSQADCLGRPQPLNIDGLSFLQWSIALARESMLGHHPSSKNYNQDNGIVPALSVATAYRRDVFGKVGFFDESFDACEDVELNYRLDKSGLSCYFSPCLSIGYVPLDSLTALFNQMMRYGAGRMRLFIKHPRTFSISSFAPIGLISCMVFNAFSMLIPPDIALLSALMSGLYIIAIMIVSGIIVFRKRDVRHLVSIPIVLFTIHLGIGCGIVRETIRTLLN